VHGHPGGGLERTGSGLIGLVIGKFERKRQPGSDAATKIAQLGWILHPTHGLMAGYGVVAGSTVGSRFGVKDLILYLFLIVILVSVWLSMVQVDRQWLLIRQSQDQIAEQSRDIAEIRRQLRGGVALRGSAEATDSSDWSGFRRALEAKERSDFAEGDWLVDYFPDNLLTLTPILASDAYGTQVQQRILDTLITRDPETLEWLPLVAESWQISDDGLTIRFKIRDGVVFADGTPLTAEDVAFTHRMIMDERIAGPRWRAFISRISRVTVEGDDAIFHYDEPYFGTFELAGTMPILAEHFYGPYLESTETAEDYNRSTGLLFGSGPYRLEDPKSWTPDQQVELVRNERYWGATLPPFDRLVYKVIQNDAALLTEFRNGDIDIYRARPLDYRELKKDPNVMERATSFEYFDARGGYVYVAWNQERDGVTTKFADRRVREAMTLLTDRARLVDEVLLGYAKPANGPFNPLGAQIDPTLPTRTFDLDKAKALLKEAGFEDRDGDGVIESADGEPFRFSLTYPSGSDDYKRIMLLLKDLYVQAGIIMDPEPTDWPLMLKALNDKTFDAISLAWTSGFEIDLYQFFHSSQREPGGDNFMAYQNPELDSLIEAARAEMDIEKRMPLWQQAHKIRASTSSTSDCAMSSRFAPA
jgi:peptide/nickel transport system substrate-binding protein